MTKTMMEKFRKEANDQLALYCTECCTTFKLHPNGDWVSERIGKEPKVAEVIQNRLILCTCGTPLGVYAQNFTLPGEVVPIN